MNSSPFPEEAFQQHPMTRSEASVSRINESEVEGEQRTDAAVSFSFTKSKDA